MSAAQRDLVLAEAATWLGTPYHHHGRVKGAGVDCAMFLCEVFEACGLVPRIEPGFYPPDWHLHRGEELFAGWLARHARQLADGELPHPGDVLLFRFGRTFSHGSIWAGDGLVWHSYIGRGVIRSRITEEPLEGRPFQVWSLFP